MGTLARARPTSPGIGLATALLAVGVGVHLFGRALERGDSASPGSVAVGALPDGHVVRIFSLGFERIVADLFWLRAVNYVGDERSASVGYADAGRLATLITDIDPRFKTVYVLMHSVLTSLAHQPKAAIELLDKGIRHLPDSWRLHFLQGYSYFMYEHDWARAAHEMRAAAERGGPSYLPLLAARLYSRAGDPETAIAFVIARLQQEKIPEVRAELEARLRDLEIVADLRRIDAAVARYRAERGAAPERVADLVRAGFLAREPHDPEGGRYSLRDGAAWTDLDYDPLVVHGVEDETSVRSAR
ncbi:MAG: tetratricopeptide repeat protein [Myxococcota bacterium]